MQRSVEAVGLQPSDVILFEVTESSAMSRRTSRWRLMC
jgi:hypothetical protein